jgi:hypothetical protein
MYGKVVAIVVSYEMNVAECTVNVDARSEGTEVDRS